MRALLRKHLHGKKVLILLVLTNLLYGFMILITIPKVMQYTQGMKIFDMMPTGYDAEYAKTLLDTLGTAGRNTYLCSQIPADLIYPGLFGISYCILIAYFLKQLGQFEKPILILSLLPLIGSSFDYLENLGTIMMLTSYPDFSPLVSGFGNVCTILKSIASTLSFVTVFILLVWWVIMKMKPQGTTDRLQV